MTELSSTIAALRKGAGLTQEQLGEKLGISYQAVSKWETGVSCPDISSLPLLADIFGVTIDELFGRERKQQTEEPQPEPKEEKKSFWSELAEKVSDGIKSHVVVSVGGKNYASRRINDSELLPWPDDDSFRAVLFHGHKLIGSRDAAPEEANARTQFEFTWNGSSESVISDFSVTVNGDVEGSVEAGLNVSCRDVNGEVEAGGCVQCGDVSGDVEAGTYVECGDVSGDVEAGMNVSCVNVEGSVEAGLGVTVGTSDQRKA